MSSSMSAVSLEDGVMVKISIEPVFSNKPAAAGKSGEEVMKIVKWIADVYSEIEKMKILPKEFALSINVLSLLINLMKEEIKNHQWFHTAKFMHKTFLSWKRYLDETELTLQNNHNSKFGTKSVTSIQKHINLQESSEEKTHSLFTDVSAVDPNLKKEKEIMVMPSDLSLSSSSHVENSCSILRLQQQRKTRRSWSKDLHEQFLVALKKLGGPQTATPKRIREVMKVNGLTNDEVKSHLQLTKFSFFHQKYRIYSQKNAKASHIVDQSLSLYEGAPREHYATWNQTASVSPESPFEFEKVDDELCFEEELGDSGKDVGIQALTFPAKGI